MTSPMAVTYNYNGNPADLVLGSANNARYGAVILDEFYIYEHALPSNASSSVYWNYFLNWNLYYQIAKMRDPPLYMSFGGIE